MDFGQLVYQRRYDRMRPDQGSLHDQAGCGVAEAVAGASQRLRHIEEEPCGLVVLGIEGKPCDPVTVLPEASRPSGRKGSLAEPCTRLDHRELLRLDLGDQAKQSGPLDQPRRASWGNDLGGKELRLPAGTRMELGGLWHDTSPTVRARLNTPSALGRPQNTGSAR